MKTHVTFLVNNDIVVHIPTTVEKKFDFSEEEIRTHYHNIKLGKPKLTSYIMLAVTGRLNLTGECNVCGLSHSKAGFTVEYAGDVVEYWSVFYNNGCETLQHVDVKSYTPQRMKELFEKLETVDSYDEVFQETVEVFVPAGV